MVKKALSLLLVLIMVLGLMPASLVQAANSSNVVYVDDVTSVDELENLGVVVRGDSQEEEPGALTVPTLTTSPSPQEESMVLSSPTVSTVCDCGKPEADIYNHSDNCALLQYYIDRCSEPAGGVFGLWLSVDEVTQRFLEDYLSAHYPDTLQEVYAMEEAAVWVDNEPDPCDVDADMVEPAQNQCTGEASATLQDVTVDAAGVPEGSSLTVTEASEETVSAAMEAMDQTGATSLFVYDISVQNEESDNWQPEDGFVELTLTVPEAAGLPKYTPVKIVHVDDLGNTSTIDSYVGEDGKIVFETGGFSTFAGFTVDFDYEGVMFCLEGLTSIKLSELFDQLKMPLNAADVVNVEYTDDTQLQIEQQEGDWLLTSLKAFDTEEQLTLTMVDGMVYSIKVTDDTTDQADCYFAYRHNVGVTSGDGNGMTRIDNGYGGVDEKGVNSGNGYVRVFLNANDEDAYVGSGGYYTDGTADGNCYNRYFWAQPLIFDGKSRTNPEFTLSLRRRSQSAAAGSVFYLEIWHWYIIGGAQVTINVGDPGASSNDGFKPGDTIIIRQHFDQGYDYYGNELYQNEHMIEVGRGSLKIQGNSQYNIRIVLDGNDVLTEKNEKLPIRLGSNCTSFTCEAVTFRNAPNGAVFTTADNLTTFSMKNCYFESTVKRTGGNFYGGAIYTYTEEAGAENTIGKFELLGCTFDSVSANNSGGAVLLGDYIKEVNIGSYTYTDRTGTTAKSKTIRTKFDNCDSGHRGGAIAFHGSFGKVDINADFEDCDADRDGGAIYMDSNMVRNTTHYGRMHTLNLTNSTFKNCIAKGTYDDDDTKSGVDPAKPNTWYAGSGGGVFIGIQIQNVNVSGCTFDGCQAQGGYVNLSGAGICFSYTNVSDTSVSYGSEYSGSPDKDWLDAMTWGTDGGSDPRSVTYGLQNSAKKWVQRTTMGTVSISNTTFKNSVNTHQGGAFTVRTGASMESLTMSGCTVQNCKVKDKGAAVFLNNCIVGTSSFTNCTFKGNEVLDGCYTGGGILRTVGKTSTVMTVDNCDFIENKGNLAGGGIYWNAGRTTKTPDGTVNTETMITVKNSRFRYNTALSTGGVDYHEDEDTGAYYSVGANYFTRYGGAIFCETKMKLESCTFEGNKSEIGGAVCMSVYNSDYRTFADGETTQLKLDSSTTLFKNQAVNGGALAIRANPSKAIPDGTVIKHTIDFTLGGAQIYDNVATENGGGIHYRAELSDDELERAEVENYVKTITIDNGMIYNNTAGQHGGGIYMESSINTTINVSNGTIYNNEAGWTREVTTTKTQNSSGDDVYTTTVSTGSASGGNGGGIYMTGSDATVKITGGVIGAYIEKVEVDGEEVENRVAAANKAHNSTTNGGGHGGGIAIYDGPRIVMSDGYVVYNKADVTGGGIAVYNGSSMYFTNGYVDNNEASRGGGIAIYGCLGDDTSDKEIEQYGMYLNGGHVTNNKVTPYTDGKAYGGGVYVGYTSDMKINNGEIADNIAASNLEGTEFALNQEGGGIAVYTSSTVEITGGQIKDNEAYDGGGISIRNQCTVTMTGEVTLTDGVVSSYTGAILGNRAERRGGGISMPSDGNSSMTMSGGYIYNNKCEQYDGTMGTECLGGGIHVRSTNSFTLKGGRIDSNSAFSGGGIHAYEATKVSIENGVMSDNTALRHGGAIYNDYSTVEVTGGEFYNNKAKKEATGYPGSQGNGGAIFNYGSSTTPFTFTVTGNGANFHDNEAKQAGGAIYSGGTGTVTISGGTFTSNKAATYGGAISNNDQCSLNITTGTFQSNTAKDGGAIYATGGSVAVSGGKFNSNISTRYGGGAYFYETTVTNFTTGTFDANVAKNGGGLCITDSTVQFTGGTFQNNIADRGGALFIRSSEVDIETITIQNNHAQADSRYGICEYKRGGGICVDTYGAGVGENRTGKANITIDGGTFSGNTADYGGGLWINNNSNERDEDPDGPEGNTATLTINGGNFISNTANVDGGGIWIGGGGYATDTEYTSLTLNGGSIGRILSDGTYQGNVATGNGGGVWAANLAKVFILATADTHGEVSANTAKNGGGVYVTTGADLTVTNGYITYNKAVAPSDFTLSTPLNNEDVMAGVGGGICVSAGVSSDLTTFTLNNAEGKNEMAIYGNKADYAADDVYSCGIQTQLSIPQVKDMDLGGYGIRPEGWFEDYNTGDESYLSGLNMLKVNGNPPKLGTDGLFTNVYRYRNATASERLYMHIQPSYVSDTGVNQAGAYVAMTLGIPAAVDDIVVVDYGLKVPINVWKNDLFMKTSDFANTTVNGSTVHHSHIGPTMPSSVQYKDGAYFNTTKPTFNNDNGYYQNHFRASTNGEVYNLKNGTMTFELEKMYVNGVDSFFYVVEHNNAWYYATVTVIPATSVYFEDNTKNITYHTTAQYETLAQWEVLSDDSTCATLQDQDRPGVSLLEGLDANNIYGYDGNYATSEKYSNGSVHKVHVYRTEDGTPVAARATFVFTGTGFDIISLCNSNTGVVSVSVWEGTEGIVFEDDPSTEDVYELTDPAVSYVVDTWYNTGELYQVPVIKVDMNKAPIYDSNWEPTGEYYGYGTYTVEIYVAPGWYPKDHSYNGCDFYLDAIRIYDPVEYNGGTNQTVQNAYIADGEGWPVYQELRMLFLSDKDITSESAMEGILFIDGSETPSIKDYKSWGPNNEIYLKGTSTKEENDQTVQVAGQGIAFTLNAANYASTGLLIDKAHIGMRGLTGSGTVELYKNGTLFKTVELSATDMYYDITGLMDSNVTIKNVGSTPVAISNLKVTHKQQPTRSSINTLLTSGEETGKYALSVFTSEQLASPTVTPKYPALSFNGMICYNVFFSAEDMGDRTAEDLGLAVFYSDVSDGTVENADEVHLGAELIDGLYMVSTDGVNAKYLGDTRYFRAFAKKADGSYVYSKTVSYSAADYATNILAKSENVQLKQLVIAMLNYGAEAQKFFGYKTDDLMNKNLTADHQALVSGFDAGSLKAVGKVDAAKAGAFVYNGGYAKRSPAISFNGAFEINYFMTPAYAVEGHMTMYFWNEDTYNSVTELTAENADKAVIMTLENGTYTACSDEIIARRLDETVYVAAVYESEGVTYCSGVLPYSIAAYCQNPPAGVQDLATAAAIYGCTAKEFFGS